MLTLPVACSETSKRLGSISGPAFYMYQGLNDDEGGDNEDIEDNDNDNDDGSDILEQLEDI